MKEVNVKVLIPDDVDPKKVLDLSLMVRYQKENDTWQFVTMPFVLADADKAEYIKKEEVIAELNNWAYFEMNVQRKPEVSEHRKDESQIVIYVCEALKNHVNRLHTYLIPDSADIEKIRAEILALGDDYCATQEVLSIIDKHLGGDNK